MIALVGWSLLALAGLTAACLVGGAALYRRARVGNLEAQRKDDWHIAYAQEREDWHLLNE